MKKIEENNKQVREKSSERKYKKIKKLKKNSVLCSNTAKLPLRDFVWSLARNPLQLIFKPQ